MRHSITGGFNHVIITVVLPESVSICVIFLPMWLREKIWEWSRNKDMDAYPRALSVLAVGNHIESVTPQIIHSHLATPKVDS